MPGGETTATGLVQEASELVLSGWGRAVAARVLAGSMMAGDIDDVLQETAMSIVRTIDGYDPAKGALKSWVAKVIERRAKDMLSAGQRRNRLQDRMEVEASGVVSAHSITEPDFADEVADRVDGHAFASDVLELTASMIANPESFHRTKVLMVRFDGHVASAAAAMGLTEDQLRDSKREFGRCGHVVAKALQARAAEKPVTMRTLLDCLPTESDVSGKWTAPVFRAVAMAGGFQQVTAAHVMEVTGYSYNSARQYISEVFHLVLVAKTIMEQP